MLRTESNIQAIKESRMHKSISKDIFMVDTMKGRRPARIVMQSGRNPVFVYRSCPGIVVHEVRPTTKQVDSVQYWEPF